MTAVIDTSETLVTAVAGLPTPRMGAAALALALGRVAATQGIPLDGLLAIARVSHSSGDVADVLRTPRRHRDEIPS